MDNFEETPLMEYTGICDLLRKGEIDPQRHLADLAACYLKQDRKPPMNVSRDGILASFEILSEVQENLCLTRDLIQLHSHVDEQGGYL